MTCSCGRPARYPIDAPALCVFCFIRPGEPARLDDALRERIQAQEEACVRVRALPLLEWAQRYKAQEKPEEAVQSLSFEGGEAS